MGQRVAVATSGVPDGQAVPTPHPRQASRGVLDGRRTGGVLLFAGVFAALVGATFTATGWTRYRAGGSGYEWTQLLGPVLVSAGVALILTSVCKFGLVPCRPRRRWDEEEATGQPPPPQREHPLTLSGTAVLCLPPSYNCITQHSGRPTGFQPHPATVYRADGGPAHSLETDGSRAEKTESGRGDDSSTCSRPPAYEDIFPSFNSHGLSEMPNDTRPT